MTAQFFKTAIWGKSFKVGVIYTDNPVVAVIHALPSFDNYMRISFLRRHTPPVNYTAACSLRRIVIRSTQPAGPSRAEPSRSVSMCASHFCQHPAHHDCTGTHLQSASAAATECVHRWPNHYQFIIPVQCSQCSATDAISCCTTTTKPHEYTNTVQTCFTKDLLGIYTLCPKKSSTPNSRR